MAVSMPAGRAKNAENSIITGFLLRSCVDKICAMSSALGVDLFLLRFEIGAAEIRKRRA